MGRRGASSCGQPEESLSILTFHLAPGTSTHFRSWHENEIEAPCPRGPVESKGLSKEAAHPVADHRPADPPTRREAEPAVGPLVLGRHHQEERSVEADTSREDTPELGAAPQPLVRPKVHRGPGANRLG